MQLFLPVVLKFFIGRSETALLVGSVKLETQNIGDGISYLTVAYLEII